MYNLAGTRRVLYRLPELLAADKEEWVFITEGEKDVDAIRTLGGVATTNAMGAGAWRDEYGEALRDRRVAILPDNDDAGRIHAREVAESLADVAAEVRITNVPGLPEDGGDITDYLETGGTLSGLIQMVDASQPWESETFFVSSHSSQYPVSALPEPLRRVVEDGAASFGVPPEMIAVPLLSVAGAVIGNTAKIVLKEGFSEFPTIWSGVVAEPGSGKSPGLNLAMQAVELLQTEAMERYRRAASDARSAEKKRDEAGAADFPVLEHYYSTDTTPEAIAKMLTGSVGVALVRDELSGWVAGFDQYRRGGERQGHMSGWAGSAIKVDRAGRDSIHIPNPVVCVTGGIQPDRLSELAKDVAGRDGFVERMLLTYPDTKPQRWNENTVRPEVVTDLAGVFRKLRARATEDPSEYGFSKEAKKEWIRWHDANAAVAAQADGYVAGVLSKMPRQVARIALVLHCVRHADSVPSTIDTGTLLAAIEVADFHAAAAVKLQPLLEPPMPTARFDLRSRVLRALNIDDGGWRSTTDLHARLGGHVVAVDLREALAGIGIRRACRIAGVADGRQDKSRMAAPRGRVPAKKRRNQSRFGPETGRTGSPE